MANALFGEDSGIMGMGQEGTTTVTFTGFARVVDAATGQPIQGAQVQLVRIADGTVTALSDTLVTDNRGQTPELTLAVPGLESLYWSAAATGYQEARVPATGTGFETPDEVPLPKRVPVPVPEKKPPEIAKMGIVHYALLGLLGVVIIYSVVKKLME